MLRRGLVRQGKIGLHRAVNGAALTGPFQPVNISGLVAHYVASSLATAQSPTQIGSLATYFRADLGATVVAGKVTALADQSGSGDANKNLVKGVSSDGPTYNATDGYFGNQPSMSFDQNFCVLKSGVWASAVASNATIFVVKRLRTSNANTRICNIVESDHSTLGVDLYSPAGGTALNIDNSTGTVVTDTESKTKGTILVVPMPVSSHASSYTNELNAATGTATGNGGTLNLQQLFLGNYSTPGAYFGYDIAEFAIFNKVLSASEIANLTAYASARYSIAAGVGNWKDQSNTGDANQNLAQASQSKQPTLNVSDAAYNNQPTLSFLHSASQLLQSGTWSAAISAPFTAIVIGNYDGVTSSGFLGDEVVKSFELLCIDNGNDMYLYGGSAFLNSVTTTSANPRIIAGIVNDPNSAIYISAKTAKVTGGSVGAGGIGQLLVGVEAPAASFLNGKIAEVIIYNRALTQSEINIVLEELGSKYNIAIGS